MPLFDTIVAVHRSESVPNPSIPRFSMGACVTLCTSSIHHDAQPNYDTKLAHRDELKRNMGLVAVLTWNEQARYQSSSLSSRQLNADLVDVPEGVPQRPAT
jgi:hypothetical protein